ncbi:MAG: hypothetical protein K8R68_05510 [Bacteroidales bacterium]|nr:hypothetical protein [Bacteroidales bacterium]
MKGKILKYTLIFSGLLLFSCAKTPVYKSNLQTIPFQFNGSDEAWLGQFYYDSKARMLYGLSNDEENIYVRLKVTDQATRRKIILSGLTFWMDSVGKNRKQMTIRCPMPRERDELKNMKGAERTAKDKSKKNFNLLNKTFFNGHADMEIMGFDKEPTVMVINNKNENGINVMMKINDQEELIWEAIIPLKMAFTDPAEFKNGGNRFFSFGFESGAFDAPQMGNSTGADGRKPGGGRGGHEGGQRGGNMNQQSMPEMQAMMTPSKVKIKKVNLTFKNN